MKNAPCNKDKDARRLLARVWTCVLVLALLAVLSVSSVGAYAATYASRDPQVLFLDATSGQEVTQTMDLFQNAYINDQGQTVVVSEDGSKVVAPGTSGSYSFAVRNSGGQPATYKVWAETAQDGASVSIPLDVALTSGSATCQNLADAGELDPGNSAIYAISWQWPFEEGQDAADLSASDARDTTLGNLAAARRATYAVTLHMQAEAEYPPAQNAGGRAPFTGEQLMPVAILGACGLLLLVLAVIAVIRNRREARK